MTTLDGSWKRWIRHNVERGCSMDELFRILIDEGFEHDLVQRELGHRPTVDPSRIRNPLKPAADAGSRPIPQHPDPALIPGLQQVPSPHLEIYRADDFLDGNECRSLIALMTGHLRRSEISAADERDKSFRVSRTCDLNRIGDPLVAAIDDRICRAMQCTAALAEPTQAQYYDVGGEFKPHTDYFEANEVGRYSTATLGQRTWTFMIYLNEPESGGETAFTSAEIVSAPKTGRALIWNNLLPDGRPNPGTIHHGMPVRKGHKAIITKWFRMPRAGLQ